MADPTSEQTQTPETTAAAEAARAAVKASRRKARKELRAMHGQESRPGFDHRRYHELHYLAAGRPVPDTDPDDLD